MPKFIVRYIHKKDVEVEALVEAANHKEAEIKARDGYNLHEFEAKEEWTEISRILSVRHKTEEEAQKWEKDNDNLLYDRPDETIENLKKSLIEAFTQFSEFESFRRLGYDSEKEPGVKFIIEGARGQQQAMLESLKKVLENV